MDSNVINIGAARPRSKTYYERWIEKEGLPIIEGFGVTNVRNLTLKPWTRVGGEGAYLQLRGLEGITGIYIGKIAPRAATQPERHLYEKVIYILEGEGVAEIQQRDRVPQNLQWRAGSLFSPPMNTLHRLMNYSSEPALYLAVTTAPRLPKRSSSSAASGPARCPDPPKYSRSSSTSAGFRASPSEPEACCKYRQ